MFLLKCFLSTVPALIVSMMSPAWVADLFWGVILGGSLVVLQGASLMKEKVANQLVEHQGKDTRVVRIVLGTLLLVTFFTVPISTICAWKNFDNDGFFWTAILGNLGLLCYAYRVALELRQACRFVEIERRWVGK